MGGGWAEDGRRMGDMDKGWEDWWRMGGKQWIEDRWWMDGGWVEDGWRLDGGWIGVNEG